MISREKFLQNLEIINQRIESTGRLMSEITIVAVTKGHSTQEIKIASEFGISNFGENYAAELISKAADLKNNNLVWHFLGKIQTNKISKLTSYVKFFQGITREVEINKLVAHNVVGFVELNPLGDPTKAGVSLKKAYELIEYAHQIGFSLIGVMVIGVLSDPFLTRKAFQAGAKLAKEAELKYISMGMTDDLEIALQEGSNMLRLGRGFFS
jgi:uncharacterized pyridoxal phosphate-containing UPF0001 family protein